MPPLPVRSGSGGTPSPLRVISVVGNAVTLAWSTPAAGLDATDYLLEGGVAPQQTLASVRLGTAMTLMTLNGAPTGVFYLRLTAMNGAVRGGTSNEVRVVVGVPKAPAAPTGLTGLVNGIHAVAIVDERDKRRLALEPPVECGGRSQWVRRCCRWPSPSGTPTCPPGHTRSPSRP